MGKAVNCSCGSDQLKWVLRSDLGQCCIACDTCGNTGPAGKNSFEAGEAWNKAMTKEVNHGSSPMHHMRKAKH
jgi:hypothetical protein